MGIDSRAGEQIKIALTSRRQICYVPESVVWSVRQGSVVRRAAELLSVVVRLSVVRQSVVRQSVVVGRASCRVSCVLCTCGASGEVSVRSVLRSVVWSVRRAELWKRGAERVSCARARTTIRSTSTKYRR